MKKYFLLILILKASLIFSQKNIKGKVHDSMNHEPVLNAIATLINANDTIPLKLVYTNEDGFFSFSNVPSDTLVLTISKTGYEDQLIYIPGHAFDLDLKTILLSPNIKQLNEVIIKAYTNPMFYRHDTVIYIADSFKIKSDATVEDLLKILPRLKVNKQGVIMYQNKVIDELLVDGDDFFGKDQTIATRNLNSSSIESVEIYEKQNENETGSKKIKVLNLKLKEAAKKGLFGKIAGASDFGHFFEGTVFINKFKNNEKASAYLLSGNTPLLHFQEYNSQNIREEEKGDNLQDKNEEITSNDNMENSGISKITKAGMYYGNNLSKKAKIKINYYYITNSSKLIGLETSKFDLLDTTYTSNNDFNKFTKIDNNLADLKINYKIGTLSELEIQPTFSFIKMDFVNLFNTTFLNSKGDPMTKTDTKNSDHLIENASSTHLIFRHYFKNPERLFRINYGVQFQTVKSLRTLNSYSTYYENFTHYSDSINQQRIQNCNIIFNKLNVFYQEPIANNLILQLHYNYSNNFQVRNIQTKGLYNGDYIINDSSLTNSFNSKKIKNTLGLNMFYERRKHSIEVGGRLSYTFIKNVSSISLDHMQRDIFNILPYLNYKFNASENCNFNLNYYTNSDLPPLILLQPIKNNENPNQITIGNPDLLPTYNQNFDLSFDKTMPRRLSNLWINLYFSKRNKDFAAYILYDSIGRSIEKSINIDGNYDGYLSVNGSILFFSKTLELNPNINIGSYKNINIINNKKNILKTSNAGLGLNLTIDIDSIILKLSGNYITNVSNSDLNVQKNIYYYTQKYLVSVQIPIGKKLFVESSAEYNKRNVGYNRVYILWNISINKTIKIKKENLVFSVIGIDILNQNISLTRSILNNVTIDSKTNVISRYFLIRMVYKFNSDKSS